jgi:hypothetical protein
VVLLAEYCTLPRRWLFLLVIFATTVRVKSLLMPVIQLVLLGSRCGLVRLEIRRDLPSLWFER